MEGYSIRCWAGYYSDRWVVVRDADQRIMTEGSVFTCCRWVGTWAIMDAAVPKAGTALSETCK